MAAAEANTPVFPIYEVTFEKEIVWKYRTPFVILRPSYFGRGESKLVFQAHRFGEDFRGFQGKTWTQKGSSG